MILSGVLFNACGPMPDVKIKFEAQRTTLNGVVYSAECCFTTQEDGSYYIELEPGYYTVSWIERGRPVRLGSIVAAGGSEMSLPAALEADYTPAEPSYVEDAIVQMQAALEVGQQVLEGNYVNGGNVQHIVTLTLEEYDALTPPDPATLYIIEDD